MYILYDFVVIISYTIVKVLSNFNRKLKLFVEGRKNTLSKISHINQQDRVIWIHAASLGEFEQAIPIIQKIKEEYQTHKIVVSFFSPSGYEIRKNYPLADVVCYLPIDTRKSVNEFIAHIHPEIAIIIKYEFWPNLLKALKQSNTHTILVSGIFRKNQLFFKKYGSWLSKSLKTFNHFFVQNQESNELLNSIGYTNVTITGDTRFDRVSEILKQQNDLTFAEEFKNNTYTVVAGSSWKEDEQLLINYINNINSKQKFIIAPHNIHQNEIKDLKKAISKKTICYSEIANQSIKEYQVLIIDTIGLLTKLYKYANVAYVGGGLKTGLHNILEPATYGIPVIFGKHKYQKFQEAKDLIDKKGAFSIGNETELNIILDKMYQDEIFRKNTGKINQNYIVKNTGATSKIMTYINHKI